MRYCSSTTHIFNTQSAIGLLKAARIYHFPDAEGHAANLLKDDTNLSFAQRWRIAREIKSPRLFEHAVMELACTEPTLLAIHVAELGYKWLHDIATLNIEVATHREPLLRTPPISSHQCVAEEDWISAIAWPRLSTMVGSCGRSFQVSDLIAIFGCIMMQVKMEDPHRIHCGTCITMMVARLQDVGLGGEQLIRSWGLKRFEEEFGKHGGILLPPTE